MSGNFDFPPANTRHSNASLDDANNIVRDSRTHRTALRHRLDEVRRLRDDIHDDDERRRLRMQQSAVREEIRRRHAAEQAHPPTTSSNDSIPAITTATRSRMGSARPGVRSRLRGPTNPTGTGGSVQQAVERLNEASSNLSSLLDTPIPRIGSPQMSAREYSGEAEVNRRRKRRKLDPDPSSTGHMNGFSYGYRGQVVSGPLHMELESCDGGIHTEAARNGREYWPDNVLRNDKSVYCTDNSKCNIVLRHMGETTFCLKKLVIKAPERGFTAPIQEGMVFVSMTSQDLLARTAQYQMRDPSPSRDDSDAELRSSQNNADENRPLSRRRDSSALRTIPPPISNSVPRSTHNHNYGTTTSTRNNPFPLVDIGDDSTPPPRTSTIPGNLGFDVITNCNDPSSDEEEPSSAATLADLYRRDRQPPPYTPSTDDEDEDALEAAMRRTGPMGLPFHDRRSGRRAGPSKLELTYPPSSNGTSTDASTAKDVLAPHARFFIESEKSVVTMKFDPPVSGKFILVKFWSPAKGQNIDIQSIVCHGFSGPRFFPAARTM